MNRPETASDSDSYSSTATGPATAPPIDPAVLVRLGGLSEVGELLDRSTNVVCAWVRRPPRCGFVAPVHSVAATKLWDLEQVREWGRRNPRRVGPAFRG